MGTQHQNIIEINGKKYDAVTGKLMQDSAPATKHVEVVKPNSGGVVDGFTRRPNHSKSSHPHTQAAHVKKTVQKSHTLMRTAVKKPAQATKAKPAEAHIQKSHLGVQPARQQAAVHTKQSPQVSKFGDLQHRSSVVKKVQHLPVKKQAPHLPPSVPSVQAVSAPVLSTSRSTAAQAMIENALATSHSHEEPHHKPLKKRRKAFSKLGVSSRAMAVSTGVLAAVLLAGFFAVQNVPNISMRVAAARAGFSAGMPNYNPSGFSYQGPINYSSGQVTVSFRSNTDDRSYSVTQKKSNWNSDALLSNFVVSNNKQYQTYLDRGRTLYIYDGSNATWVDNGVWYQIEGDSDLTTDQLVRIAASI